MMFRIPERDWEPLALFSTGDPALTSVVEISRRLDAEYNRIYLFSMASKFADEVSVYLIMRLRHWVEDLLTLTLNFLVCFPEDVFLVECVRNAIVLYEEGNPTAFLEHVRRAVSYVYWFLRNLMYEVGEVS